MPSLTVRADEELLDALDEESDERGISRAELVRRVLRDRDALGTELDECEARVDELKTRLDRVHREKRQVLDQREEHTELVRAIERDQSLAERRAKAGLLTKARWAIVGMPDE